MAVRDPATFVPALCTKCTADTRLSRFMNGVDPCALRWSEPVRTPLWVCPDAQFTLWCTEDMPLVWPEVMQAVTGLGPEFNWHGGLDVARQLLTPAGNTQLRAYLSKHPPRDRAARRAVVAAFIDAFGVEDAMLEEVTLPGWTDALMAEQTARYEDDLGTIVGLPNVRKIVR